MRSPEYLFAAVSGLLLALSFPTFGSSACSWIALAPLLVALRRGTLRKAFVLGAICGGVYFAGTLYWLASVMAVYGGLAMAIAVPVTAALVAYLALFPALFAVIVRRLVSALGPRAFLAAPFVWVATELGRTYLFTGFPWVLLGYSQTTVLPIAQLASLTGVYGIGALVASVSASFAFLIASFDEPEAARGIGHRADADRHVGPVGRYIEERYVPLIVTVALVLVVAGWGAHRASKAEWTHIGEAVRVGLVQGNVDQAEKWNEARGASIFNNYLDMSRQAIRDGAQLVLWPESSTPFAFEEDRAGADRVRQLAADARVPILFGSNQIVRGNPNKYFNAAFVVRSDGTTGGVYQKMHLVPFGEYVPLRSLFFFASRLVEAVPEDFSPGESAALLSIDGHLVSTSICYEVVYPGLVRHFVREGSELLTTITNDAWFGRTSAPYQHFEQASMRAIEEGRYLVRAANTGISGIVDPYGHVITESPLYAPATLVGEARFLRVSTLYARTGDLFAYLSTAVTVLLLLQSLIWRLWTT